MCSDMAARRSGRRSAKRTNRSNFACSCCAPLSSGRDREGFDSLELFLVNDAIPTRVDVAKLAARSFASPSPLPRDAPR